MSIYFSYFIVIVDACFENKYTLKPQAHIVNPYKGIKNENLCFLQGDCI